MEGCHNDLVQGLLGAGRPVKMPTYKVTRRNFCLKASLNDGIWTLEIRKVGHDDGGTYECQTNTEVKTSVSVQLNIMGKLLLIG